MEACGVQKNSDNDDDDATSTVCVGVELVEGTQCWPPACQLWKLLQACLDLSTHQRGSPAGMACFFGSLQWSDLLRRPLLSNLDRVYKFAADYRDWRKVRIPNSVIEDAFLNIVLGCFWGVDMRRPFLPFIAATDASSV